MELPHLVDENVSNVCHSKERDSSMINLVVLYSYSFGGNVMVNRHCRCLCDGSESTVEAYASHP